MSTPEAGGPLARFARFAWANKAWWILPLLLSASLLLYLLLTRAPEVVPPFVY